MLLEELFTRILRARRTAPPPTDGDDNVAVKRFYELLDLTKQKESSSSTESEPIE